MRCLAAVALLVVAACAPTQPVSVQSPTRSVAESATASPTRPVPTPAPTPTPTPGPAGATVEVIARGLEAPWAIDLAPDGRLFVTERPGRIRVIRDGVLLPAPWATLPAVSQPDREMGLLGLALDPEFALTRLVYVYYTYRAPNGSLQNRLVRLRDEDGRGVDERILLDGIVGGDRHDGGRVRFGPDGLLYVTTGEAERSALAQDRTSLSGKVLRLRRDGGVPEGNPFLGSYVYSLGHRHPQGLAFDARGVLYATEHGPSGDPRRGQACCHDEVNRIEPGANYGWPLVFGIARNSQFRDPVHESGDDTWAPSGATFVTRGRHAGSLLFAALRGEHLHRLVFGADGTTVVFEERLLARQFGRLRDVFEAPDGTLYVLTQNRDGRGRPAPDDDRVLRVVLR